MGNDSCISINQGLSMSLFNKKCEACSKDTPPLKGEEITNFFNQIDQGWKLVDEHHIVREYKFKDFNSALEFTNRVGALAEEEGHHPDIFLTWGQVTLTLFTHKIDGLSESDFIFASKCDQIET